MICTQQPLTPRKQPYSGWMFLADNLTNVYTPGFRENKVTFKTFLGGAVIDNNVKNLGQGKSTPGTSNENLFLKEADILC